MFTDRSLAPRGLWIGASEPKAGGQAIIVCDRGCGAKGNGRVSYRHFYSGAVMVHRDRMPHFSSLFILLLVRPCRNFPWDMNAPQTPRPPPPGPRNSLEFKGFHLASPRKKPGIPLAPGPGRLCGKSPSEKNPTILCSLPGAEARQDLKEGDR